MGQYETCPVCRTAASRFNDAGLRRCGRGHVYALVSPNPPVKKHADKWLKECPDGGCKASLEVFGKEDEGLFLCRQHLQGHQRAVLNLVWWASTPERVHRVNGWPSYRLSFSACETLQQCDRKYYYQYLARLPKHPGWDAEVGLVGHRTLELNVERERDLGHEGWRKASSSVWLDEFVEKPSVVELTGRDPSEELRTLQTAQVRLLTLTQALPTMGRATAVELRHEGDIDGVPFVSIIDREYEVRPKDRSQCALADWKTGAPREDEHKPFQLALCAELHEKATNRRVTEARFVYANPFLQKFVDLKEVRTPAIEWVVSSRRRIDDNFTQGHWPASPTPLCGWCDFVEHCPEGQGFLASRPNWPKLPITPVAVRLRKKPRDLWPAALRGLPI